MNVESERRSMSDELRGTLGKRTALALLADIDSACEKSDVGDAFVGSCVQDHLRPQ